MVDTSQADALLAQVQESTANLGTGLLQAVADAFLPDVIMLSETMWGVRTGEYSNGWYPESAGGNMVVVSNYAESISDGYPYSLSLEYGWRGHAGGFVGQQAAEGSAPGIAEALLTWVMSRLP